VVHEPFELRETIDEAMQLIRQRAAQKGLTLVMDWDPRTPPSVMGDAVRVRQILLNYLSNAVKFTDHGEVRLKVEYQAPETCTISVTDAGIGIPFEKQEMLFRRFAQAGSSAVHRFGGTGLGLAISKQLAELMSGSVGLESLVGAGSTFWVRLPLPAAVAEISQDLQRLQSVHTSRPLVLVADDNRVNQKIASMMLAKLGCEVDVTSNGTETLERWSQRPYDAIFMDCQMPDVDGYEATQRIRVSGGRGAEIPIIATTASSGSDERQRCLAAGMTDYITKPLSLDSLKRVLNGVTTIVS
jgi:CheY-like chemotaxis protein